MQGYNLKIIYCNKGKKRLGTRAWTAKTSQVGTKELRCRDGVAQSSFTADATQLEMLKQMLLSDQTGGATGLAS